jgi:taurine--2-oxoglutarate transaminase
MTSELEKRYRERVFLTWSEQSSARGLEIVDAKGARFEVAGKGWVWDLESQVYNVTVGHKHPWIEKRMIEQIQDLPACAPNAMIPIRVELAEKLAEVTGLDKAFFGVGGSEAVENAIKIARLVTGRTKIVTRKNSYHGATLTVLGLSGDPRREPFVEGLPPAIHIDDPFEYRAPTPGRASDWLESFDAILASEGPSTIAGVLLEGYTGTNGMQEPPPDFWPGVRARCDEHGILLIDDEIFAGFGRTGRWFATEHWGVRPDMMTIGKGLTSGCAALSGVMVDARVAAHFEDHKLWCGLTHYAHPVSCAAALGTIEVIEREGLVANAQSAGQVLREHLESLAAGLTPRVRSIRGRGLMQAIEFDREVGALVERLWDVGLYVPSRGAMLFLCPPLCVTRAEVDEIFATLDPVVRDWLA